MSHLRTGFMRHTHAEHFVTNTYPPHCDCGEIMSIKHILTECICYYQDRRHLLKYLSDRRLRLSMFNLLARDLKSDCSFAARTSFFLSLAIVTESGISMLLT